MLHRLKNCTLGLLLAFAATANSADKPNVVLMLADNLGYGDLSVYNDGSRGGIRTPNIDRLAGEGMRFTQFHVEPGHTSRTTRTRASKTPPV